MSLKLPLLPPYFFGISTVSLYHFYLTFQEIPLSNHDVRMKDDGLPYIQTEFILRI